MEVLLNRLGYASAGRKRAVIEATTRRDIDACRVLDNSGETVHSVDPAFVGGVAEWGEWVFWTVEFSAVTEPGTYALAVDTPDGTVTSPAFEIDDNLLQDRLVSDLLFHLKSQRSSGRYDQADRAVPFVGDREGSVDVHGGWYDASGDMSKYLSHLSYANYLNPQQTPIVVWGLADARRRLLGYDHDLGDQLEERLTEETLHGADFLLRMLDDDGYFYMTVFDQWSKDLDSREICTYETADGTKTADYEAGFRQGGGVAIAALARASALDGPGEFASEKYLNGAIDAFEHLQATNEAYLDDGTANVIDDYCALLAATELYDVTGEARFREAAADRAESLCARQTGDDAYAGWFRADDAGERPFFHAAEEGLPIIALLRYLDVVGDDPAVRETIADYWAFELAITDDVANPFGYARQYVKAVDEPEPRDAFFMPHDNESGYWWQGENARIASLAAAAFRSRDVVEEDLGSELAGFARDQLDWILGSNPFGVAMLHGVGPREPEYHESFRNAPGGVCNGITAGFENEDDIAFCPDPVAASHDHRWRWAEQWLPHAAWLLIALAADERV